MLHVESRGRGDKLIVLGGGPGFSHSYLVEGLAPLERDFELIYVDYPGCGRSRATQEAAPFPATVDAVIGALRPHWETGRAQVLCHSFGATVLGAALAARPKLAIEKCVLANPSPPTRERCDSAETALLARISDEDRLRLSETLAGRASPVGLAKRLLPYYCGRDRDLPTVDLDFYPDAYTAIAATIADFDFVETLATVPNRLYLFGSSDFISPDLFTDALAGPGAGARTLPGGHFLFADAGPEFCRTVAAFFREDSAAGRR